MCVCVCVSVCVCLCVQVKEVTKHRDAQTLRRKNEIEDKLERARQLRVSHLQEVVRKAHDEDAKV